MGKIIDPKIEFAKQFVLVQKDVASFLKKHDCNIGDWSVYQSNGVGGVQVDHDGGPFLAEDLADVIRKRRMEVTTIFNREGVYDWRSDTYHRPFSVIDFKYSIKG